MELCQITYMLPGLVLQTFATNMETGKVINFQKTNFTRVHHIQTSEHFPYEYPYVYVHVARFISPLYVYYEIPLA